MERNTDPDNCLTISRQEISDELMQSLTDLIALPMPSEADLAQRRSFVIYTLPSPNLEDTFCFDSTSFKEVGAYNGREANKESEQLHLATERSITLLESHSVISVAGNTGQRTWEAALHLAAYLVSEEIISIKVSNTTGSVSDYIRGKHVLELGAGTGLVSMVCMKYLAARLVLVTDGDESVVDALKTNIFLNETDEKFKFSKHKNTKSKIRKIQASVLRWGHSLSGTSLGELLNDDPPDTVVAADVVSVQILLREPIGISSTYPCYDYTSQSRTCLFSNFHTDIRQDWHCSLHYYAEQPLHIPASFNLSSVRDSTQ